MGISKAPLLLLAFFPKATKKGQGFILSFYRPRRRPSSSFSDPKLRPPLERDPWTSIRSLQFSDRLKNLSDS
ncbi:MAG: hypothetical protein QOI53_3627 [Verrucomicrobiota bacterium]|jgi:hypothetical protein|nr:hypothetical protein [Verrucomicrobiota bacterium]